MARYRNLAARAVDGVGEALENFRPFGLHGGPGDVGLDQQRGCSLAPVRGEVRQLIECGPQRRGPPLRLLPGARRRVVEPRALACVGNFERLGLACEVTVELGPITAVALVDVLDGGIGVATL